MLKWALFGLAVLCVRNLLQCSPVDGTLEQTARNLLTVTFPLLTSILPGLYILTLSLQPQHHALELQWRLMKTLDPSLSLSWILSVLNCPARVWTQVSLAPYFNPVFLPTPLETGKVLTAPGCSPRGPKGMEGPGFLQLSSWLRQITTATPRNGKPKVSQPTDKSVLLTREGDQGNLFAFAPEAWESPTRTC